MLIIKRQLRYVFIFVSVLISFSHICLASGDNNNLLPDEKNTIAVFKKVSPYVVNVHRLRQVIFPSHDVYTVKAGTASGFIWNNKGYIVTNFHVIRGASRIAVTVKQGKTVYAKVVGIDQRHDIAVLKFQSMDIMKSFKGFNEFPVADSTNVQVGQKTIAIGNPYGLDRTVTTGIVSALGRRLKTRSQTTFRNLIQTDASINPGNSGGPLISSEGKLIGMNTAIISRSGASAGVGFAVPSSTVKRYVDQLIKNGIVSTVGIGVYTLPDQVAKQMAVRGVIIASIIPNTPAAKANLQGTWRDTKGKVHTGDIIVEADGQPIKNNDDLVEIIEKKKVGHKITLRIVRDKKEKVITLKAALLD